MSTSNPHTLTWVNPTQGTDQNNATVPFDATVHMKGIEIQFDNGTPIEVDLPAGTTSYDMSALPEYRALSVGSHKIDIAILTAEGVLGGFSASVTFPVDAIVTPLAPTSVAVA